MSRNADRAFAIASALLVVAATLSSLGCEQLDGRNRNRKGNRLFREMQFVGAAGEYERAIKEVDDPTIHYNLGLAYSKVFKPGYEGAVLLDVKTADACQYIPGVKTVNKQVCLDKKEGNNKTFAPCDDKNVCPSSFECKQTDLCALDDTQIADLVALHFDKWLQANPTDIETRGLMTQVWMDSSQYEKATKYWQALLDKKPNDPDIMGVLAGIALKAGDWRTSIDWYNKVAGVATVPEAKVAAYTFIGNVAWSKLNSKTLTGPESVELADKGIAALQHASEVQPDNPKPISLMGSIFNFRGLAQGASWAAGLDRATAQDLQRVAGVLRIKANKAAGVPAPPTPTPAPAQKPGAGG